MSWPIHFLFTAFRNLVFGWERLDDSQLVLFQKTSVVLLRKEKKKQRTTTLTSTLAGDTSKALGFN